MMALAALRRKFGRRLRGPIEKLKEKAHLSRDIEDGGACVLGVLEALTRARDAMTFEEAAALYLASAPVDGVPMKAKAEKDQAGFTTEGCTGVAATDVDCSACAAGKKVCVWVCGGIVVVYSHRTRSTLPHAEPISPNPQTHAHVHCRRTMRFSMPPWTATWRWWSRCSAKGRTSRTR